MSVEGPKHALQMLASGIVIVENRTAQGLLNKPIVTTNGAAPIYLKVVRSGNTFSAYTSSDGTTWTLIAGSTVTLDMGDTALIGIAVTSKVINAVNTTIFDKVERH